MLFTFHLFTLVEFGIFFFCFFWFTKCIMSYMYAIWLFASFSSCCYVIIYMSNFLKCGTHFLALAGINFKLIIYPFFSFIVLISVSCCLPQRQLIVCFGTCFSKNYGLYSCLSRNICMYIILYEGMIRSKKSEWLEKAYEDRLLVFTTSIWRRLDNHFLFMLTFSLSLFISLSLFYLHISLSLSPSLSLCLYLPLLSLLLSISIYLSLDLGR